MYFTCFAVDSSEAIVTVTRVFIYCVNTSRSILTGIAAALVKVCDSINRNVNQAKKYNTLTP